MDIALLLVAFLFVYFVLKTRKGIGNWIEECRIRREKSREGIDPNLNDALTDYFDSLNRETRRDLTRELTLAIQARACESLTKSPPLLGGLHNKVFYLDTAKGTVETMRRGRYGYEDS